MKRKEEMKDEEKTEKHEFEGKAGQMFLVADSFSLLTDVVIVVACLSAFFSSIS